MNEGMAGLESAVISCQSAVTMPATENGLLTTEDFRRAGLEAGTCRPGAAGAAPKFRPQGRLYEGRGTGTLPAQASMAKMAVPRAEY